ncbi:hypothetical protein SNEBB_009987 [Seison nebaliae]|nr:hypothetical protein SNEBB_009987 [Seison nebaliae]
MKIEGEDIDFRSADDNRLTLMERVKKTPLVSIGMTGFFSLAAYRLFKAKREGWTGNLSLYVIHTRLMAQGFVVSLLCGGAMYRMYQRRDQFFKSKEISAKE